MAPLHRLWPALEDVPGGEAVLAEWRFRLGADFDSVQSLLRQTDREAGCYPALSQSLPYRVVKHGPDDFAGVPADGGETIYMRRVDVLIHRIDHRRLAKEIAAAFGLLLEFADFPGAPATWRIGSIEKQGGIHLPVHLVLPIEPSELRAAIEAIVAQIGAIGILIAPTRRFFNPASESLLRLNQGHFISLGHSLLSRDREKWFVNPDANNLLAAFLHPIATVADEPLNERSQLVLVAMLELTALDSDRRRSTEEIGAKAIGDGADPNSLKGVMADLKTRGLIDSKTGRTGGCWLTDKGRMRAEKLRRV